MQHLVILPSRIGAIVLGGRGWEGGGPLPELAHCV